MATPTFPSPKELIIKFLSDIGQYKYNMFCNNPMLIDMDGEQMYVYIKNLSPAQLSNDNPDIWRIQLPMRKAFEEIKKSNNMFVLLGYDYIRQVYTTWNPYWCKQRLNVAESCSLYSRISLQQQVSITQQIERKLLQNEGDVLCIPPSLLSYYLKNIKKFYPEESTYVPVGSSIQKRKDISNQQDLFSSTNNSQSLFEKFLACFDLEKFKAFLSCEGIKKEDISNYCRLAIIFENGFIKKHENLFLECTTLKEYKRAINRFCWQPDIRRYEELWNKVISKSLLLYLKYVEKTLYGTQDIEINPNISKEVLANIKLEVNTLPKFELDQFGKLKSLDAVIIDELLPQVRGIDYPDYELIIKRVKEYYPDEATQRMTPADWIKLFNSTKWRKKRRTKAELNQISLETKDDNISNVAAEAPIVPIEVKEERIEELPQQEPQSFVVQEEPDILINPKSFNSVFDNKTTSYKYFWVMAIISLAKEGGKLSISFDDIVKRMVALAWPIVFEDGIDLGKTDMIPKYVKEVQMKTYIVKTASSRVVESSISSFYKSRGINNILSPLLNYVPYRFLSPWVKSTSIEEVVEESNKPTFTGLYAIHPNTIVLNNKWWEYIESHYNNITDFIFDSFINYVKQFNSGFKLLRLMKNGWSIR